MSRMYKLWRMLRWRVALQLLIWGVRIAPPGVARGSLIDLLIEWIDEGRRACTF